MNISAVWKNSIITAIGISLVLLICLIVPAGGVALLERVQIAYVLPIFGAIILFTVAITLPLHQKRLSLYIAVALIAGILFLASGLIQFGYSAFVKSLPYAQGNFPLYAFADLLTRNLEYMAMGLILAFVAVSRLDRLEPQPKVLKILAFGLGVFIFVSGAYEVVRLLQTARLL